MNVNTAQAAPAPAKEIPNAVADLEVEIHAVCMLAMRFRERLKPVMIGSEIEPTVSSQTQYSAPMAGYLEDLRSRLRSAVNLLEQIEVRVEV